MSLTHDEITLIKSDLDQLRAFMKSEIVSPAVRREIDAAVHRVENMLNHEEKEEAATGHKRRASSSQIDVYYESPTGMHPLGRVSTDFPVSFLKSMLMGKSAQFVGCERVRVERTGAMLSLHSSATIGQSGMLTGDVVVPEQPAAMAVQELGSGDISETGAENSTQSDERVMFYRLVVNSGCFPVNPFEAVIVAAHYYLLASTDLVCLAETPSSVPGFAPSVRELPRQQFLPPKWNSNANHVILFYRSKQKPKFTFKCEYYLDLDTVSISFGYKDCPKDLPRDATAIMNSIDIVMGDYINTESLAFKSMTKTMKEFQLIYENEDDLFEAFPATLMGYDFLSEQADKKSTAKQPQNISEEHLPGISGGVNNGSGSFGTPFYDEDSVVRLDGKVLSALDTMTPPGSASSDAPSSGHHHFHRKPAANLAPVSPLHPLSASSADWKLDGAKDTELEKSWNSASPPKHHHNRTSVGADDLFAPHPHHGMAPLQPLNSGGGMMMGPDHPAFHSGHPSNVDIFQHGGIRDARYDPIMPPVSSGTGLDPDMLGGDRLMRPPRGKGKNKLQPGEPNPDHLKPPSWNQGPGFI